MNLRASQSSGGATAEIPVLIETLLETEKRLEELTSGEVDTVAGRDGRTFMLRRAQEQVRHSEAGRQSAILNALTAYIALLDAQGNILSVNEAWHCFAVTNVVHAPGHGVGLNYLEVCDRAQGDFSSEAHQVAAGVRLVLGGTEKSFSIEYPCHSPAEQRWFLLTVTPLAEERRSGAVVMHVDITARRQAEAALLAAQKTLLENEERYRSLVVGTSQIIWTADSNGLIIEPIPSLQAFTGQRDDEIMGLGWTNRIHPDDIVLVLKEWSECIKARDLYRGEMRLRRHDGEYRWLAVRGVPIFAKDQSVREWVGAGTDITEKRKMQETVLRNQRMESMGALAGGIAHDLNNVLSPIMMGLDFLKKRQSDEKVLHMLGVLESSAQRGADMVRQIVSFARGSEENHKLTQIKHILLDVERIIKAAFPKTIEIAHIFAADLWLVEADPTQLHQIIMNLCVNAQDAMPQGGTLTLKAENVSLDRSSVQIHPSAKPGPYILITVSDTGTGIAADILEKITEPFFTTKEAGKGTGLGLSTVDHIVKNHDGFIKVASEVGRGTQFKVYLPASKDAAVKEKLPENLRFQANGELILVVDDEVLICEIAQELLEGHGFRVLVAYDGTGALAKFVQHQAEIHAVLMDLEMPFMDGLTASRALKQIDPMVKIVTMTGLSSFERMNKQGIKGLEHCLRKPFTTNQLLKALQGTMTMTNAIGIIANR